MIIEASGIGKIYGKGTASECRALKSISFSVEKGESIAVLGKSGSGKSTLLHILGLLDNYDEGSLIIDGQDVRTFSEKKKSEFRNKKIGIVMQNYSLIPDMSVFDNVAVPLYISGDNGTRIKNRVVSLLNEVGLPEKSSCRAGDLSGGQKQRVALARAMASSPILLLADEPTGALDQATGKEMLRLMLKCQKKGTTLMIVTHDIEVAKACDRIMTLSDGSITGKSGGWSL